MDKNSKLSQEDINEVVNSIKNALLKDLNNVKNYKELYIFIQKIKYCSLFAEDQINIQKDL